jgi:hypothetical protein
MSRTCYACGNRGTTKEHVPPQCLFPDAKDTLDGRDHRKNLITVRACVDHNNTKSKDDELLLWVLGTNLLANAVGLRQAETKLARSYRQRPKFGNSMLNAGRRVVVADSATGQEHETVETDLDGARFERAMRLIALGIHFEHFRKPWGGSVQIHADFLTFPVDVSLPQVDAVREFLRVAADTLFATEPKHGENPDVFWYQVKDDPLDGVPRCAMRLAFYGGCKVTVFFGFPDLRQPGPAQPPVSGDKATNQLGVSGGGTEH